VRRPTPLTRILLAMVIVSSTLILVVVIELKKPCRELVVVVFLRLLRYPEDPRPVLEEVKAVCRVVVLM
jgi:hypothetical protein